MKKKLVLKESQLIELIERIVVESQKAGVRMDQSQKPISKNAFPKVKDTNAEKREGIKSAGTKQIAKSGGKDIKPVSKKTPAINRASPIKNGKQVENVKKIPTKPLAKNVAKISDPKKITPKRTTK